ncbi:MAG TPA: tol-pal system protein YbgF [Longimicrobiales bacterium]|nr:tol-pal system protein YbgF [Longimicrobiales bacterium]
MMRSKERSSVARAGALALTASLTAACATKSDIRDLHTELLSLAARQDSLISELRRETLSTQDTLRTQSDQLFDFRGDIAQQLRAIAQGQQRLEALVGENQRGIAGVRDQLANLRTTAAAPPPPTLTDSPGAPSPGTEAVAGAGGNADQLWRVAREQHQRGSFSTAQRAYEQFLEEYPSHELAPDAHFYLADILVQQNRPEDAVEAFLEIQRLYPTADRVPDALYRVAILQRDLGDTEAARETLQRIVNTYPDAPMAMLARDLLEEIG